VDQQDSSSRDAPAMFGQSRAGLLLDVTSIDAAARERVPIATTKLMHERGHEATVFELLPR